MCLLVVLQPSKRFSIWSRLAIVVGVAFPRFRVDQSIRFFFKIPTLVGIFSIIYVQMMFTS